MSNARIKLMWDGAEYHIMGVRIDGEVIYNVSNYVPLNEVVKFKHNGVEIQLERRIASGERAHTETWQEVGSGC